MANGDDINVTLTWPSQGAITAYITRLTSVPEGVRIYNDNFETTSRVVDCLGGYAYHQETYWVDMHGTHLLKVLDFVAGQPAPPPTNLQVTDLSTCLSSSKSITVNITGFEVNSAYNDGDPVTGLNLNGSYTASWNGGGWQVPSFVGYIMPNGDPISFDPFISCAEGVYGIDPESIPGYYGPDFTGAISLGGSISAVATDDPTNDTTTGGTISITPAS